MDQHTLSHCVSAEIEYEYNLDLAPRNQKMILLTIGGTSIQGSFTGDEKRDSDIMGFYPLPKRNKVKEDQLKKEGRFPWTKLGVI